MNVLLTLALLASSAGIVDGAQESQAQAAIRRAEMLAASKPLQAHLHLQLAQAWLRRANETGNPAHYDQAQLALAPALSLSPDNLPVRKLQIEILLGKGLYGEALELVLPLHRKALDDIDLYGYLTDVHIALGEYDRAEEAAQWMLDLRPTNVEGLLRAAQLRELFGDHEGAIDFLNRSALGITPTQPERQAQILSDISRILLIQGRVDQAETVLGHARKTTPNHHAVLGQLAAIREHQGRRSEALDALRLRCKNGASPEFLFDFAAALHRTGHEDEAKAVFAEFERAAKKADAVPAQLVFYYVDFASRPDEALELARKLAERRRDLHTRYALARALFANRLFDEAWTEIDSALQVGRGDPAINALASQIKAALGR